MGRAALDQFLLDHIPDDHEPHRLHTQLLELPWSDAFTTNWDTLLERASDELSPNLRYSCVYSKADLSHADAPRIIKLHGSLPAHRPFIVTREDYRTYDKHYAALGHTLRQAFMEGIVLLLGFSGDDANFLRLHGRVFDDLQADTPRLFLGGFLQLTESRRRLLEHRGIVPIDLADHRDVEVWGDTAHRDAVQWILDFLGQGNEFIARWPDSQAAAPTRRLFSDSVSVPTSPETEKEPKRPDRNAGPNEEDAAVRKLIRVWHNFRKAYAGWIVVPFRRVGYLSSVTDEWDEILLRRTKTWPSSERLVALRELLWRYEILMNPHKPGFSEAIKDAVREFDRTPVQRHGRDTGGNYALTGRQEFSASIPLD